MHAPFMAVGVERMWNPSRLLESLLGHVIAGCLVLDRNLAAQYSL